VPQGAGGQAAGRSTLEKAKSSWKDETEAQVSADGGRRETAGPGGNTEAVAGAGNPMYPVIRSHIKLRGASNLHERELIPG
jgi:hypothetical protein